MTDKPENPPAFPLPLGTMNCAEPSESGGMTLRDYFASDALSALVGKLSISTDGITEEIAEMLARDSYLIASAMLKARHS